MNEAQQGSKVKSYDLSQRREIALTYAQTPYGSKSQYAKSVGVCPSTIKDWIAALADGDLESGLIPRKTGKMTRDHVAEIRRLEKLVADRDKEVATLQKENARQAKEFDEQRKQWQDTDESWRRAVDGLGKAIDVMRNNGTT